MRLYAHWLDGAFLKIKPKFPGRTTIKTLALFGWNIILSQNQIIDSKVILGLFADRSFREFLEKDHNFLQLVGEPLNDTDRSPLAVTRRALDRCLQKGWISSTFSSPRPTKELARALIKPSEIYPERLLSDKGQSAFKVIKRWDEKGKYGRLLRGMVHAVGHFSRSDSPTEPEDTASPRTSLYDKLIEAREILPSGSDKLEFIENTLDFIEDRERIREDEERASRSIIFNKIDNAIKKRPFDIKSYQTIKNTVMHAYNAAVQDSLSPEFGSNFNLPFSAPIGLILHTPTDVLTRKRAIGEELFSRKGFREFVINWDPTRLTWNEIASAVEKTKDSRKEYQKALESEDIDEMEKKLGNHIKALMPLLVKDVENPIPRWVWWVGSLSAHLFIAPGAGIPVVVVGEGVTIAAGRIQSIRDYTIANALHRVGRKFHPDS